MSGSQLARRRRGRFRRNDNLAAFRHRAQTLSDLFDHGRDLVDVYGGVGQVRRRDFGDQVSQIALGVVVFASL